MYMCNVWNHPSDRGAVDFLLNSSSCSYFFTLQSHSVALGIGITLLVLVVLGGIFLLYRKRKLVCLQNG